MKEEGYFDGRFKEKIVQSKKMKKDPCKSWRFQRDEFLLDEEDDEEEDDEEDVHKRSI